MIKYQEDLNWKMGEQGQFKISDISVANFPFNKLKLRSYCSFFVQNVSEKWPFLYYTGPSDNPFCKHPIWISFRKPPFLHVKV